MLIEGHPVFEGRRGAGTDLSSTEFIGSLWIVRPDGELIIYFVHKRKKVKTKAAQFG